MPDRIGSALHSMRNAVLGTGAVIIVLLGVLFFVVFTDRHNEADRRHRETTAQNDSRVENCHHYNEDQKRDRNFQVSNIVTLVQLQGRDVEAVKADPRFQQYVDFVNSSFPYRQCSIPCVTALADPKVPDCPLASDENGDP